MSKIILVANCIECIKKEKNVPYIGIDRGALLCMKQNIPLLCAVGDFDSIEAEELAALKEYCEVIQLPVEKDMVDSEFALRYAHELGYDEIHLYGVMGGRMDHFMVIYELLKSLPFPFTIQDEVNTIYRLDAGEYTLPKRTKYISFFACESLHITIEGVKYPLQQMAITSNDVYLSSNEIIGGKARLVIDGRVIVMECQKK